MFKPCNSNKGRSSNLPKQSTQNVMISILDVCTISVKASDTILSLALTFYYVQKASTASTFHILGVPVLIV